MKISSPEFENQGTIPIKFTCQGEDINPSLKIEDIPKSARSLVLILDDPDAPSGVWVHWIVYNIKVLSTSFDVLENSIPGKEIVNSFQKKGYGGPCPPQGTHRYFFKVYALDRELDLEENPSLNDLRKEMKNHILDEANIIGLYKKKF